MIQTSTLEKLILYYFNETAMADTVLVQQSIDNDPIVECEYENIKSSGEYLDRLLVAPSDNTIASILSYATLTSHL